VLLITIKKIGGEKIMSIDSTINKLQNLRLYGMVKALNAVVETGMQGLSSGDLLAHIVDSE